MAKEAWLPTTIAGRIKWMKFFAALISTFITKYKFTQADVLDLQKGALHLEYWFNFKEQAKTFAQAATAYSDDAQNLINGVAGNIPEFIDPGTPPEAVAPGALKRAIALASIIKKDSNYSIADGIALQIEGTEKVVNLTALKPSLVVTLVSGGRTQIAWNKQGMEAIEIYCAEGNADFTYFGTSLHPVYADKTPLPAPGVSIVKKFKAIYLYKDNIVGQYSDIVTITVTG